MWAWKGIETGGHTGGSTAEARIPGPRPSGPRFPFSAESGIGDSLIPDFGRIGNRGFPIPEKKRESGENRGLSKPLLFGMIRRPICGNRADFPSERPGSGWLRPASTTVDLGLLYSAFEPKFEGPRLRETQGRGNTGMPLSASVDSRNILIGSRVYNHALAGRAACGSYSGSERGNMLLSSAKAFASRDCAGLLPGASGILLSLTVMSCATFFASST